MTVEGLQAALNFDIDLDIRGGLPCRRVGSANRSNTRTFPGEDDPKTLCQMLLEQTNCPLDMKSKRKIRVRDDFDDDDLVFIEGWYLAVRAGFAAWPCGMAYRTGVESVPFSVHPPLERLKVSSERLYGAPSKPYHDWPNVGLFGYPQHSHVIAHV